MINAYINLEFKLGDRKFNECFYVTKLGKQRIILGFPWLHKYNLIIDWKKLPLNPSESTGDALWKKANDFNRNNNLR
jgi:hypothetical protein